MSLSDIVRFFPGGDRLYKRILIVEMERERQVLHQPFTIDTYKKRGNFPGSFFSGQSFRVVLYTTNTKPRIIPIGNARDGNSGTPFVVTVTVTGALVASRRAPA